MKTPPIVDLHTCIQGEGSLAGIPHILIRVVGCNLRCMFENSICDTPYSSFDLEKGKYSIEDIGELIAQNPHINHILLSGGEPCIYPEFIEYIADNYLHHITVETNGTLFIDPRIVKKIGLVSISPKLQSSIPSKEKAERLNVCYSSSDKDLHRKNIKNIHSLSNWKTSAKSYQLKYVINNEGDIQELLSQITELEEFGAKVKPSRIFLMPAGVTNEQLQEKRQWLMERCIQLGFNYSDRLQILAYGNKRGV